jgi:ligand-binding sensor protein
MIGWIMCGQVTVFMDDRMENVWTGNTFSWMRGWIMCGQVTLSMDEN